MYKIIAGSDAYLLYPSEAGYIAIITGWTPPESIKLEADIGVIGPLYSKAGFEPLLLNLLANPQISTAILLDATKQDDNIGNPCSALYAELFRLPFLTDEAKQSLLSIDWHLCKSKKLLAKVLELCKPSQSLRKRIILKPTLGALQTNADSQGKHAYFIDEVLHNAWLKLCTYVRNKGTLQGERLEALNANVKLLMTNTLRYRNAPERELLTDKQIAGFVSLMVEPSDGSASYTYADRILPKLDLLYEKLKTENTQSYISLWQDEDARSANPPCLTSLWLKRDGLSFDCFASFRSHSIYGAWIANARQLMALCDLIASKTGLQCNALHIQSLSAHIYKHEYQSFANLPKPLEYSASQAFVIDLAECLVVSFYTYEQFREEWRIKLGARGAVQALLKQILAKVELEESHVAYLAYELCKAEQAFLHGEHYKQDA